MYVNFKLFVKIVKLLGLLEQMKNGPSEHSNYEISEKSLAEELRESSRQVTTVLIKLIAILQTISLDHG